MRRAPGLIAGAAGQGRIADRYVLRNAAWAITLVAAALVALLSLFDFVEQLSLVGQGSYGVVNAFDDMLLTIPSRLLQVAPVSMLLGSLLALGALARNAELTAMLSLGVSELRIIRSVMVLVLPATLLLFVVAEYLTPSGQRIAYMQRTAALASSLSPAGTGVWAHDGDEYLNVRQLDSGQSAIAVDIYDFARNGSLQRVIHADRADFRSGVEWHLTGVTRTLWQADRFVVDHPAALQWHAFLTPPALRGLFLPLESIPPSGLYRQIRAAARSGQNVPRLQQAFWGLVGIPFSMLAMTMLVASIAFQPARTQSTAYDLTRAMAFSVVYSLVQQILSRTGVLLGLNPEATTLAPPLIVMGLAVWMFRGRFRTR